MTSTPEPAAARSGRRLSTRARVALLLAGGSAESTSWWLVAGGGVLMGTVGFAGPALLPLAAVEVLFLLGLISFLAGLSLGLLVGVRAARDARHDPQGWENQTTTIGAFLSWFFLAVGGLMFSVAALLAETSDGAAIGAYFLFFAGIPPLLLGLLIMALRKLVIALATIFNRQTSRRSLEVASWWLVASGGVAVAGIAVARTALIASQVVTPRPGVGVLDVAAIILLSAGVVSLLAGLALAVLIAVRSILRRRPEGWESPTSRTPAEIFSWIFLAVGGLLFSISVAAVAAAPPGDAVIGAGFIFLAGLPPLLVGLLMMALNKSRSAQRSRPR